MRVSLFALLFDNPLMLLGLPLLAVPFLLQFLLRRQVHSVSWGAMRFLQKSRQRLQQQLRLDQWLQLLLRSGIIASIILALASPHWGNDINSLGGSRAPVHWIFVLDASLSMRALDGADAAFGRARQEIIGLIQQSPPGSSFRLIRNCEHQDRVLIGRPTYDAASVQLELELVNPTFDRADWPGTLRDLQALAEGHPELRGRIAFFTDLQATDWAFSQSDQSRVRRLLGELQQLADLTLHDVGNDQPNIGIAELGLHPSWLAGSGNMEAVVEVVNHGREPMETSIDLLVDDRPQQRKPLTLAPGAHVRVEIPVVVSDSGEHRVEVQLPPDALLEDNRRYAVLPVSEQLNVLLVDNTSRTEGLKSIDYLQFAFAKHSSISSASGNFGPTHSVTVRSAFELTSDDFSNVDTVILCGVGDIPEDVKSELRIFVDTGGGLVLIPGEQWLAESMFRMGEEFDLKVSHVTQLEKDSQPFTFQAIDPGHPLVAFFDGRPEAGLETTRIYRYVVMDFAGTPWRPIVNYSSSDPAILTRPYGSGNVVLLTTSPELAWGSWVLWPSFVPMMREMVEFTSTGHFKRPRLTVGDVWTQSAPNSIEARQSIPAIQQPDQRTILADWDQQTGDWSFSGTTQPGFYQTTYGLLIRRFAVNVDPSESDLIRTNLSDLQRELFAGINIKNSLDTSSGNTSVSLPQRSGPLSLAFVVLAIGLWILEMLRPQITRGIWQRWLAVRH